MRVIIAATALSLVLFGSSQASADIVEVTYTGIVSSGSINTYGPTNTLTSTVDLTSSQFTETYLFNTAIGRTYSSPYVQSVETQFTGQRTTPGLGASFTVNGTTYSSTDVAGIGIGNDIGGIDWNVLHTESEQQQSYSLAGDIFSGTQNEYFSIFTMSNDSFALDRSLPISITKSFSADISNIDIHTGQVTISQVTYAHIFSNIPASSYTLNATLNTTSFTITNLTGPVSAVPEPSTWATMLLGFAGLGFLGYRRNKVLTLAA